MLAQLLGFNVSLPLILTFLPTCLALICALTVAKRLAFALLVFSLLMAVYCNYLQLCGLLTCISLIVVAAGFKHTKHPLIRLLCSCIIFILAVLMLLHSIPGFNNPKVIDAVQISAGAVSFSKYLSLDKIILAIILLIFVVPTAQRVSLKLLSQLLLLFILLSVVCFSLAWSSALVVVDLKIPLITGGWLLTNLLFSCFAEEAFFRGFIQQQLHNISQHKYWPYVLILLSGSLFGLAHFPAGLVYTIIASMTGCFYAYSYWRTNNIVMPITLHFLFNSVHFFCFTYPYFAKAVSV